MNEKEAAEWEAAHPLGTDGIRKALAKAEAEMKRVYSGPISQSMSITIKHGGSFWVVFGDGESSLGHAYKVLGFEGESGWKSALRLIFRPLWAASAVLGDEVTHLEEFYGGVFRSRSQAIGAILAFHNITDERYQPPDIQRV